MGKQNLSCALSDSCSCTGIGSLSSVQTTTVHLAVSDDAIKFQNDPCRSGQTSMSWPQICGRRPVCPLWQVSALERLSHCSKLCKPRNLPSTVSASGKTFGSLETSFSGAALIPSRHNFNHVYAYSNVEDYHGQPGQGVAIPATGNLISAVIVPYEHF